MAVGPPVKALLAKGSSARPLQWLIALAYPLLVLAVLPRYGARGLGVLLLAVVAIRWLTGSVSGPRERWLAGLAAAFAALLIAVDGPRLALLYPSGMSLAMAAAFALSIRAEQTLIERFAALAGDPVPPEARGYARALTWVWAGFLTANALVAAALAWRAPLLWWTWYTAAISYGLMGLLVVGELGVRALYKRRLVAQSGPHG